MHLYYNADGTPFIPSQELWETSKQLTTACAEGDLEAVRRILDDDESGKLILGLSSKHNSPLLVALCAKQIDVARFLIEERGAGVNACWSGPAVGVKGSYELVCAVGVGSRELIELLLRHGAMTNGATTMGTTPLQTLMDWPHRSVELCRLLVDYGARVDHADELGRSVLWLACHKCEDSELGLIEFLLDRGADVNKVATWGHPDHGAGPLHSACMRCLPAIARLLLSRGADVDQQHRGETPLQMARVYSRYGAYGATDRTNSDWDDLYVATNGTMTQDKPSAIITGMDGLYRVDVDQLDGDMMKLA